MIKDKLTRFARTLGVNFCGTEHLGVHLELDLARLTAHDPLKTIFDVGGNFGQTALKLAAAFPAATIFTFEPVPTSFARLQKAVELHPTIKAFQLALGDERGTIKMNLTHDPGANTILHNLSTIGSIDIPIDTLDAIAKANTVDKIDLLKIDVEGYEAAVLNGAAGLLRDGRVRFVYTECVFSPDPKAPRPSLFDLHEILERRGFCFVAYYAEAFDLQHGCALGNALYALRSKLPATAPGKVQNISPRYE